MSDVLLYAGICTVGYAVGIALRKRQFKKNWVKTAEATAVLFLIFTMGLRIGSNREVIDSLGTIGLQAFLFTVVIMTCSALAVFLFRRAAGFDRYGVRRRGSESIKAPGAPTSQVAPATPGAPSSAATDKPPSRTKKPPLLDPGTLIMIACVAAGILAGFLLMHFAGIDADRMDSVFGLMITVELCILLVFIGFDLGREGNLPGKLRTIGPYAVVLPLAVAAGTLAGAALCSVFLPVSLRESLAIGAGFGWYSLAPGLIMEAGYITTGAISFLHNLMREIFSILLVPIVARRIGYLEAVALPGSPSMDICLPVIVQSTSADIAIFSFANGFLLSIVVPFVVPLFV